MEYRINSITGIDLTPYKVKSIQELKEIYPDIFNILYKSKLLYSAIFITYKFPLKKKAITVHENRISIADIGFIVAKEMKGFFDQRDHAIIHGGNSYLSKDLKDITYYYQFKDLDIKFKESKKTSESELHLDVIVTV